MIWLASYPKSGNTWMRLLLREYFKETEQAAPFETKDTASYWYQGVCPKPLIACSAVDTTLCRGAAMLNMHIGTNNHSDTHPVAVVKTHMVNASFDGLPFFHPLWCKKAVYIVRDPRDIVPSFADHLGLPHEEVVEMMRNETAEIGEPPRVPATLASWSTHVKTWLGVGSNDQEVLKVTYEDMHRSPARELERVLGFYDFTPDLDAIKKAVRLCAFDRLRETQADFSEKSEHSENFFRRGIVGSHKDEVDPELVKQIEEDHRVVMEALGYV